MGFLNNDSLKAKRTIVFNEIKFFHPEGKSFPNGSHYQRGGFLHECKRNSECFTIGGRNEIGDDKGGIIVFSVGLNDFRPSDNDVLVIIASFLSTINHRHKEKKYAYRVGHFFYGKYVGIHGEMYNDHSLCIEFYDLSSKSLLRLVELMAMSFLQCPILVKDLNRNKVILAEVSQNK